MTRIVVCDTGPLLHLSEAGAIHLLQLAGDILIPQLVAVEFHKNAPGRILPEWVQVIGLSETSAQQSAGWVQARRIDQGEAAAIALALQAQADWLLSDDAQARQFAQTTGLEVHGSVGLLLWSVAAGHVDDRIQALTLLNNLAATSLWVSDRVLNEARQAIDRLLSA